MDKLNILTLDKVTKAYKEIVDDMRYAISKGEASFGAFDNHPYLNFNRAKDQVKNFSFNDPRKNVYDAMFSGYESSIYRSQQETSLASGDTPIQQSTQVGGQTTELLPFLFQTLMGKLDMESIPFLRSVNWSQTMSSNIIATVREAFGGLAQPVGFDQTATPEISPGIRNFYFSPGMWESRIRYGEEFLTTARAPTEYDVRGALDYMDFGIAKVSFQILQRMIQTITHTVTEGVYQYDGSGNRSNEVSMGFTPETTINLNWGTYNKTTNQLTLDPTADPAGDFIRIWASTQFPLLLSMRSGIKAIHMNNETSRAFTESARNQGNPLEAMGFSAVMTKNDDPFSAGSILMSNTPQMPKVPVVISDAVFTYNVNQDTGAPTDPGDVEFVIPTGYIILEYDNMAQFSLNYTARTDYMPAAETISQAVGQYLRVIDNRFGLQGIQTPSLEVYGGYRGGCYMPLVYSHQVIRCFNIVE